MHVFEYNIHTPLKSTLADESCDVSMVEHADWHATLDAEQVDFVLFISAARLSIAVVRLLAAVTSAFWSDIT